MDYQLDIIELGNALKKVEESFGLKVLIKMELSGGWFTIDGKAYIKKYPEKKENGCKGKDNIIHIQVVNNEEKGSIVKITGINKKFEVNISDSKYKEINFNNALNLNTVKINKEECKIRIDKNIIFTVDRNMNDVVKIFNILQK